MNAVANYVGCASCSLARYHAPCKRTVGLLQLTLATESLLTACPSALQTKGTITYNGQGFDKFVAVHTAAYVDQVRTSVSVNLLLLPCIQSNPADLPNCRVCLL